MAKTPERKAEVYFVGAGVSSAFGLPNTQQLLDEVHELAANSDYWGKTKNLGDRLTATYSHLYPVANVRTSGFRPAVGDFFTVLHTYNKTTSGFPGAFSDARNLQRDLRRALAHCLLNRLRALPESGMKSGTHFLSEVVAPQNYVITTNWDMLLERFAHVNDIPFRYNFQRNFSGVTILKLHGSIDWCLRSDRRKRFPDSDYSVLREKVPSMKRIRFRRSDRIFRIRVLEDWSSSWQLVKSRAEEPFILTMSFGKSVDLEHASEVWRDAYRVISMAKRLSVVGYSLPNDDLEIRTLLISGLKRGRGKCSLLVKNPAPDVHARFREAIDRQVISDYQPIAGW